MTPWLPSTDPQWQLAGWTMLLFLGVGTTVAALGAAVRLACRRAAPNVRYALSLATLLALATTPVAVAAYLAAEGVPAIDVALAYPLPPGEGRVRESQGTGAALNLSATVGLPSSALPIQAPTLPEGSEYAPTPSTLTAPSTIAPPTPDPTLNDALAPTPTAPPSPLTTIIAWLPVVWLAGAPVTFALLAAGLVGSRSLRRTGLPLVEGPVADACRRLQRALGVTRRVALAACDHVAQPVLIGILRPTILLPAAAIAGWSPTDLEMILLHELAHVRRWDNLVNLIQRLIESLLFFHPCVWLASRQVRRDREDCCDELVVRHTNEPEAYATLLINVASSSRKSGRLHPRHTAALLAASTMAAHPLASRVRRILKIEDEPMRISRRMLALILLLAVSVSTAAYRAFAAPAPILADGKTVGEAADGDGASGDDGDADSKEDSNEVILRRVYKFDDSDEVKIGGWMRLIANGRRGVEVRWLEDTSGLVISAPDLLHREIAEFLEASRRRARTSSAQFAKLNAELVHRTNQLNEVEEELTEIEVLKEVALQAARSTTALDQALAQEISKDPQIRLYKEQLFALKVQIQQLESSTRNPQNATLKRYQAQYQELEQTEATYRAQVEKTARERLARAPNEALRAAIAEYNVRREAAIKKQRIVEAEIADLEAQLVVLTGNRPSPTPSRTGAPEEPVIAKAYPVGDVGTVDFAAWMRLIGTPRFGVDIRWHEDNRSLVVNAPETVHKQVAEFLSRTRDAVAPAEGEASGSQAPLQTIRLRVLPNATEANVQHIVRDLSAAGQVVRVEKEGEQTVIVVETSIPDAKVVWETHMVDGVPEMVVRLVSESRGVITGPMPAIGSPYATPVLAEMGPGEIVVEPQQPRVLQPGDRVLLQVSNDERKNPISGTRVIEPEGTLPLGPGLGRVAVAGRSITDAERELEAHLARFYKDMRVQLTLGSRPAEATELSNEAATFRYDGKTFDEWRDAFRYELNDDQRVSAMIALAAFARAGRGREAAEAIFDVAVDYDFSNIDQQGQAGLFFEQQVLLLLSESGQRRIPVNDWLPLLAQRLAADRAKWRDLAIVLFERLETYDPQMLELLPKISANEDRELAHAADAPRLRRERSWPGLLDHDKNKDGRIEAGEADTRVWRFLEPSDANDDQAVTEDEWTAAQNRAREEQMMRDH